MSANSVWTRRHFMALAGAAAGASLGPLGVADAAFARAMRGISVGRARSPQRDADWADVLSAFDLGGRATMNTANLAPAAAPARAAVETLAASIDADPSFQNRAQFSDLRQSARQRAAAYLGADSSEIVLTRNTSESNNFVVQGVDLGPGDEVLLTEHNHPSNRASWHFRARRHGFDVVEVPVSSPPPGPEALFEDLTAAVTPRTRVISYSHVTNLGGCRFPAKEINEWARQRDILTLVDGAQTCGAIDVDLHDIGCDFYSASGHKWPCSPREVGVLYVREESRERLWPAVVSVGFDDSTVRGRMESLGQRDDAALAGFGHAMLFLQQIGSTAVEERLAALTGVFKEELSRMPEVTLYTPPDPSFSGGVVTFHMEGIDARRAHQWLYQERQIVCAPSGVEEGGLRFSPHIYTSLADCERALSAIKDVVSGRVQL